MPHSFKRIDISKPQWQWSQRDWEVFKAYCHPTKAHERLVPGIVRAWRSGIPVAQIAREGILSRTRVYQILAAEELRDRVKMDRFYEHRRNLGRPIDMGGPRDEWIDWDIFD